MQNWPIFGSKEIIPPSAASLLRSYSSWSGGGLAYNSASSMFRNRFSISSGSDLIEMISISSWSDEIEMISLEHSRRGGVCGSVADDVEEGMLCEVEVRWRLEVR